MRRRLGEDHTATLDSLTNLALQHHEMGEYEAALPLAEEAVAMARRLLGPAHEETLTAVAT